MVGYFRRTGKNEVFRDFKRCHLRIVTGWVIILKWRQEKRILEVDVDSGKFQWSTFCDDCYEPCSTCGEGGRCIRGFGGET